MLDLEAAGVPAFLRDEAGALLLSPAEDGGLLNAVRAAPNLIGAMEEAGVTAVHACDFTPGAGGGIMTSVGDPPFVGHCLARGVDVGAKIDSEGREVGELPGHVPMRPP